MDVEMGITKMELVRWIVCVDEGEKEQSNNEEKKKSGSGNEKWVSRQNELKETDKKEQQKNNKYIHIYTFFSVTRHRPLHVHTQFALGRT